MLVLQKQNPELFADQGIDFFIANIGQETEVKTVEIARLLRKQGLKVQYDVEQKKLKAQFKKADRAKAKFVITLGGKELADKVLNVKRLADAKTFKFSFNDLENMNAVMEQLKE